MVNNQIPDNTVDAKGNPIPPNQTNVPEATAPAVLAELRSMMAQLQKKVNDQEQANQSLAQQLEAATFQGQVRTTRFGARHLHDRRTAADLNPTRLVFHTPGNTTRPIRRNCKRPSRVGNLGKSGHDVPNRRKRSAAPSSPSRNCLGRSDQGLGR